MNKYELRAEQQRKAALRFSMMLWTAGLALVVVILMILGLSSSAPGGYLHQIRDRPCRLAPGRASSEPALERKGAPRRAARSAVAVEARLIARRPN